MIPIVQESGVVGVGGVGGSSGRLGTSEERRRQCRREFDFWDVEGEEDILWKK